jgi:hypothetical protein
MKFNKWTLGLAAVGAVSMASAVRADEKLVPLNTAVSSTVISGYVDVAAQYNAGDPSGTGGANYTGPHNQPFGLSTGKVDGFSLNDVLISLDKPLDESPWAAGYHIDLNWGMDAITAVQSAGGVVRQGYVTMRTPVGNGIDWKMGAFDGVTGYESNTGYLNPNYTRSYGYQVNPTTELGLIGKYNITEGIAMQLGIGNRGYGSGVAVGDSSKNYIAAVALTAPDSWGWLKGSVLNAGTVQTLDNGGVNNYSVNATIATPVVGLKFGLAFDATQSLQAQNSNINIWGLYATYQATEKLGFNLRGEYADPDVAGHMEELTATIQYDLWANVVSRLEFRWDHMEHGVAYNNGSGSGTYTFDGLGNPLSYNPFPSVGNSFMIALNLVYKF